MLSPEQPSLEGEPSCITLTLNEVENLGDNPEGHRHSETLARRLPFLGLSLPTCEMGSTPARPPPPTFVRINELTERVNSSDSVNSFLTDISLCTYTHGYM